VLGAFLARASVTDRTAH